jgi:dTDP-4-dehydrorhamnose reductase
MDRLVWITGAGGLIGHHLARSAPQFAPDWTVRPLTRTDLDLTNTAATQALFAAESPSLVIHCAALTRSPACQQNPHLARSINVDATAHLARLAANIPFFFFSSDLVFDGRKGQYTEDDQPNPLSVYGETKLAAEKCLLRNPRHTVIRTSLTAGASATGNRSLTETMANAWQLGHTLRLFTDEFRSPLPVNATVRATWELVRQAATGLFHLAGAERLSRWEIGQIVAAAFPHLECRVAQSSIHSYRGAPRPADTSLNSAKAQALLSFPLPSFRQWTP